MFVLKQLSSRLSARSFPAARVLSKLARPYRQILYRVFYACYIRAALARNVLAVSSCQPFVRGRLEREFLLATVVVFVPCYILMRHRQLTLSVISG